MARLNSTRKRSAAEILQSQMALDSDIYHQLRAAGYGVLQAVEMSTLACAECGSPADHFHTMTNTTLDEHARDLDELLPDNEFTITGPMACGSEARLSLDEYDPAVPEKLQHLCSEWYPCCGYMDDGDEDEDEDEDDEDY